MLKQINKYLPSGRGYTLSTLHELKMYSKIQSCTIIYLMIFMLQKDAARNTLAKKKNLLQ